MSLGLSVAKLQELLGEKKALALILQYGGMKVPSREAVLRRMRRSAIIQDWEEGYTPTDLALKYRLDISRIKEILNEFRRARRARQQEQQEQEKTHE